ncbi:signal peptide peptidase SppA [Candidatus Woesearchaeota archaeon]|nr:signal peptide peptidase SppA [Candidatus Woesearchaeota archaeon]
MKKPESNKWTTVIIVLLVLFVLGWFFSKLIALAAGDIETGNVAIVPVAGTIFTSDGGFFEGVALSGDIVEQIEAADANPEIRAIILAIDSPGGAPVASSEVATAISRVNKTTVAWIRESGASGAYWIASATDYIVADPLSITGSIGVFGSYLDFSGLMADFNVTYERLVSGKYKDTGVPFRKLTDEERRLLQKKIDLMHEAFKEAVAKNRGMTRSEIEALATGEFFLGMEAKGAGLVDELGGKQEALGYIERTLKISAEPVLYQHEPTFLEVLSQFAASFNPRVRVSGTQAQLS